MMNRFKLIVAVFFVLGGCKKLQQYSEVPEISFKSLSTKKDAGGFDEKSTVVISFTDGDGDIGYRPSGNGSPYDDTTSKYNNNFIVKFFEKVNGVWTLSPVQLPGRIPYLTQEGSNKALKGDIAMDLPLPFGVTRDTIRYDIFIYDRALHQSNTITTAEAVITTL